MFNGEATHVDARETGEDPRPRIGFRGNENLTKESIIRGFSGPRDPCSIHIQGSDKYHPSSDTLCA